MKKLNSILITLILVATVSCLTNKKSDMTNTKNIPEMQLVILHDYGDSEEIVSENATIEIIDKVMEQIDWDNFNNVILSIDDNNWIMVGGSLGEDGLAIVYSENGNEFISDFPPETVTQMIKVLHSYLKGDGLFKKDWKFS